MPLRTVSCAPVVPTRKEPIENPADASCTATALRLEVPVPGLKANLTEPVAVTRAALGTEAPSVTGDVTAPFWITYDSDVKAALPVFVPSSTVSLFWGNPLRVAAPWAARVTAPDAPDSWLTVWPPTARAASRPMTSATVWSL